MNADKITAGVNCIAPPCPAMKMIELCRLSYLFCSGLPFRNKLKERDSSLPANPLGLFQSRRAGWNEKKHHFIFSMCFIKIGKFIEITRNPTLPNGDASGAAARHGRIDFRE